MATAFREFYPDPTVNGAVSAGLMSDAFLVRRRAEKYTHPLGLPGDLRIETDEPQLRPEVQTVVDQMVHLTQLVAGWDTYTARPVSTTAYRPALDLALYAIQRCQEPQITANSDGAIVLAWECGDRELEIEVAGLRAITAFMIDDAGAEHEPDQPIGLTGAKSYIDSFCRA